MYFVNLKGRAIMKNIRTAWFLILLGIVFLVIILGRWLLAPHKTIVQSTHVPFQENELWIPPRDEEIPSDSLGDLVRYGKELIVNTSRYLGPRGIMDQVSNGMNCQNCHLDAGSRNFANPFSAVASTYPKYRERSGRVESIEFRVNDCLLRSLNGQPIDSAGPEMRAFVAYLEWIGKDVPKGFKPKGVATGDLAFLARAANPARGAQVYTANCVRCHGEKGSGLYNNDSTAFTYPPLWGDHSFNAMAGMYSLSRLAGFIKFNMPLDRADWRNPQLSDEDAWDVAAYVASQNRPVKIFPGDWKNISKKPLDYPFGPYADPFSERQHKYGPFEVIKKSRENEMAKEKVKNKK
jgi:thiosulfate dehydrogenase